MGTDISTCCGGHDTSQETDFDAGRGQDTSRPSDLRKPHQNDHNYRNTNSVLNDRGPHQNSAAGANSKNHFSKKLQEGVEANLILQDKTKLTCLVRYDPVNKCLLLSCDRKIRAIAIHDMKAILHTADHLRRVEASAGITDVERCAAIHLAVSGNCIPLFFADPMDKAMFVEVVDGAKKEYDDEHLSEAMKQP
eukprot:Lankesteria_metandrocarpae@DN3040_c0_g1_i2.p1